MKSNEIVLHSFEVERDVSNNGGLQQIFDRRDQETFSMGRVGEKKSAKQVQEKHETSYSFKNYK